MIENFIKRIKILKVFIVFSAFINLNLFSIGPEVPSFNYKAPSVEVPSVADFLDFDSYQKQESSSGIATCAFGILGLVSNKISNNVLKTIARIGCTYGFLISWIRYEASQLKKLPGVSAQAYAKELSSKLAFFPMECFSRDKGPIGKEAKALEDVSSRMLSYVDGFDRLTDYAIIPGKKLARKKEVRFDSTFDGCLETAYSFLNSRLSRFVDDLDKKLLKVFPASGQVETSLLNCFIFENIDTRFPEFCRDNIFDLYLLVAESYFNELVQVCSNIETNIGVIHDKMSRLEDKMRCLFPGRVWCVDIIGKEVDIRERYNKIHRLRDNISYNVVTAIKSHPDYARQLAIQRELYEKYAQARELREAQAAVQAKIAHENKMRYLEEQEKEAKLRDAKARVKRVGIFGNIFGRFSSSKKSAEKKDSDDSSLKKV